MEGVEQDERIKAVKLALWDKYPKGVAKFMEMLKIELLEDELKKKGMK